MDRLEKGKGGGSRRDEKGVLRFTSKKKPAWTFGESPGGNARARRYGGSEITVSGGVTHRFVPGTQRKRPKSRSFAWDVHELQTL